MRTVIACVALALLAPPAWAGGVLNVTAVLLEGDFAPGEGLVRLLISAAQDGAGGYQLFTGLQGNTSGTGLWVDPADARRVEIHQVPYPGGAVDTETEAAARDGQGGYAKNDDTWFYEPYTTFLSGPTAADAALWRFAAVRAPGDTRDWAGFLHLVLRKTPAYDGSPVRVCLGGKWGLVGPPADDVAFSGLIALQGPSGPGGNEKIGAVTLSWGFLPGDADTDGDVDFADYQSLESNFGMTGAARWGDGDFDGDRDVDFSDYQALEANFGRSVPEPGAAAMLACGALAWLGGTGRDRRRRE